MKLEKLTAGGAVRGILPDELVTVFSVTWSGTDAVELAYKTAGGGVANQLLYRSGEARLALAEKGLPWSFDGDGALLRPVLEDGKPWVEQGDVFEGGVAS